MPWNENNANITIVKYCAIWQKLLQTSFALSKLCRVLLKWVIPVFLVVVFAIPSIPNKSIQAKRQNILKHCSVQIKWIYCNTNYHDRLVPRSACSSPHSLTLLDLYAAGTILVAFLPPYPQLKHNIAYWNMLDRCGSVPMPTLVTYRVMMNSYCTCWCCECATGNVLLISINSTNV